MKVKPGWFKQWLSRDNRASERRPWPSLVAHYWTGAAPLAIGVRDISATGVYLLTQERWYPGTVIKIVLQRKSGTDADSGRSIAVQSKVVRRSADGVGLSFVGLDASDSGPETTSANLLAARQALESFLERLKENGAEAQIEVV
jgi:hypothetical protein